MKPEHQPAIDLLAERRRTNGYADIWDLCKACGIDTADLWAPPVRSLMAALSASSRVAIRPAMGDEPVQYRLLVAS